MQFGLFNAFMYAFKYLSFARLHFNQIFLCKIKAFLPVLVLSKRRSSPIPANAWCYHHHSVVKLKVPVNKTAAA
jgi:hypothetical protein